jgi:hypothetical protein
MAAPTEDPVLRSGRREALVALVIWLTAMAYTVTYGQLYGYGRTVEDLTFVFGFPDWIFWGVVVPWATCLVVSWWFAYVFMTDESLGEDHEERYEEAEDA